MALAGAAVVLMGQGTTGTALEADGVGATPATSSVTDGHIDISGFTFTPDDLSVVKGGTLTVSNNDVFAHTFTSDAVGANGKPLFDVTIPGSTPDVTIPISTLGGGTYTYHCKIHPSMTGTLVIDGPPDGSIGDPPTFDAPLYQPPRLTGKRIKIVMRQADVQVLPTGPRTRMLTYNGTFPGPTIVRPTGADTKVTFVNRLPRKYGAVTIHEHGGHQKSMYDGQPAAYLIRHGRSRTYDYPLRDGGKPLPAALRFYHDHRMGRTTRNNWLGLQGMFLTTDPREARMGLPHGRYDVPLMITDRTFNSDNSLAPISMPGMGSGTAPDGTVGDQTLVNGRFLPYLNVQPGLYRFQILNASMFSSYNFALDDGQTFTQIGSDDGLLPAPVQRTSVLLGPAQRADVVVDFSGQAGKRILLNSIPRDDGSTAPPGSQRRFLMVFRVGSTPPPAAHVPASLASIRHLTVPKRVAMRWNFGLTTDRHGQFWSINGKRYDPKRVDHKVVLGRTERWVLHNSSQITHFVHLHEELWRTLKRDGHAPPPWEQGYEDTWRLDPGETVVVAAKFTDFTGDFMVHCHMLDHEDDSMMATFRVVRPRR
jgi:spore coat protein A